MSSGDAAVADAAVAPVDASADVAVAPIDAAAPDAKPDSGPPPACDTNGFVSVANDGFVKGDGTVGAVLQTTLGTPVDTLELDLLPLSGGAVTTGKRTLDAADASYATCKTCLLIRTKCDQNLSNCEKTYMATQGSVDVGVFGGKNGRLHATVSVTLAEVTIDAQLKTTPVPGGKSWCLTGYALTVDKLQ